jgi:hypothetical protein
LGHFLAFESVANKAILIVNHINTYLSIEYAKTTEDDLAIFIVNHINTYLSRLFFLYVYRGCFASKPRMAAHPLQGRQVYNGVLSF